MIRGPISLNSRMVGHPEVEQMRHSERSTAISESGHTEVLGREYERSGRHYFLASLFFHPRGLCERGPHNVFLVS